MTLVKSFLALPYKKHLIKADDFMSNLNSVFPLERLDEIQKHTEDFRLLERIPLTVDGINTKLPIKLNEPQEGERVHHVVFLDTETTGMDCNQEKIIELGMVRVTYSFDRKLMLSIDRIYDEFEDPGKKIPLEIQQLTHITDEMVAGHRFDNDSVSQILAGRPLVVAHNAKFDRPFFDRRFPTLSDLSWACSLSGVNWDALGDNGRKLEFLCQVRGWFYDAHRAYDDCLALLWLMHIEPEAFEMLINSALRHEYKIYAVGSPFDIKDKLKALNYRFDPARKCWYINVQSEDEVKKQMDMLNQYYDASAAQILKLSAKNRYKS